MRYKRIVSIGAHSLDAELQGGPIMIKASAKGAHCTMVHVTTGRLEDPNATQEAKDAYIEQIKVENESAAKEMGCDVFAMNYVSSELPSVGEFVQIIKAYLKKENVDLVISHARGTLHARHYYCYETVTEAVRQLQAEGMKIELLYGENCEDLIGYIPTKYVPMSDEEVDQWFKGLSCYSIFNGKVNDVPYIDYYNSMIKVRALEVMSKQRIKSYMQAPHIDTLD